MSPTLTSGQPVLISWNSINWAAEVMNPPKIDVIAHTDIGAGNSPSVKAYIICETLLLTPKYIEITKKKKKKNL